MYSEGIVQPPIAKWFDVRRGERKLVLAASAALFTMIAGHTLLETARDALFLRELEPSRLTLVYVVLALLAVAAARASTLLGRAQGEKKTLGFTLVAGAVGSILFYLAPKTESVVFALYLWTGVLTGVAVAQFWVLSARVFTIAQAKRLLGPIASAGILGGVAGGAIGVLLLRVFGTSDLLPAAASCFALALLPLGWIRSDARGAHSSPAPTEATQGEDSDDVPATRRYLRLVILLISVATMTLLCIDYVFKSSAARELDKGELGSFFAQYYALLNLVAFAFQLVLATQLLRRLGVLASVAILPLLLVLGSIMTFVVGPILGVVLMVKGADGSLRHSLHRTSTELLWMPLSAGIRGTAKPLVDTFVVRLAQALAAGGVFALAWWQLDTPRVLAGVVAALAFTWIVLTLLLRNPYLELFRIALQRDRELEGPLRLTLGSLEVLMEALSSMNPSRANAAIHVLASHGRARLIPALTLLHPDPRVLLTALRYVPAVDRSDWILPTEHLIDHASEEVRVAALGALVEHGGQAPLERHLAGRNPRMRGHAVALLADRSQSPPHEHPAVRSLLSDSGSDAVHDKVALLRAVRGRAAWAKLVAQLIEDEAAEVSRAALECAATLQDSVLVEPLLRRLALQREREAAREALVLQGGDALEAAAQWLRAADTPPRVRRHLPRTISRFPSQRAADLLLDLLDSGPEGTIRYKALRGLGRLARQTPIELDARLLERLLLDNLTESLRMRSIQFVVRSSLDEARLPEEPSVQLLLALLSDKVDQATERAFRILQLLHPDEDMRSIAEAIRSGDKASQARALEYLSTLALDLDGKTQDALRLVVDNLEEGARAELVRAEFDSIPDDADAAIEQLKQSSDTALESMAKYYSERRRALGSRAPAMSLAATPFAESKKSSSPSLIGRDHVERSG